MSATMVTSWLAQAIYVLVALIWPPLQPARPSACCAMPLASSSSVPARATKAAES